MRRANSPFVLVDGRPHLKVNFRWDADEQLPSLLEFMAGLLEYVDERDIVLLRPLSKREQEEVAAAIEDAELDVYARLVAEGKDRFRARKQ